MTEEYTPPTFHVHVDALVSRGEEILIMKRAMGMMTGAWYVPGGSLEHGESPEEAVRREIREETGLEVAEARLFRVWHYQPAATAHSVAITYTCSVPPGTEPTINEEHTAYRWVTARYYRDRYFNDDVIAALAERPHVHGLVSQIRGVLDAYLST
jgi:mutator protein MutT